MDGIPGARVTDTNSDSVSSDRNALSGGIRGYTSVRTYSMYRLSRDQGAYGACTERSILPDGNIPLNDTGPCSDVLCFCHNRNKHLFSSSTTTNRRAERRVSCETAGTCISRDDSCKACKRHRLVEGVAALNATIRESGSTDRDRNTACVVRGRDRRIARARRTKTAGVSRRTSDTSSVQDGVAFSISDAPSSLHGAKTFPNVATSFASGATRCRRVSVDSSSSEVTSDQCTSVFASFVSRRENDFITDTACDTRQSRSLDTVSTRVYRNHADGGCENKRPGKGTIYVFADCIFKDIYRNRQCTQSEQDIKVGAGFVDHSLLKDNDLQSRHKSRSESKKFVVPADWHPHDESQFVQTNRLLDETDRGLDKPHSQLDETYRQLDNRDLCRDLDISLGYWDGDCSSVRWDDDHDLRSRLNNAVVFSDHDLFGNSDGLSNTTTCSVHKHYSNSVDRDMTDEDRAESVYRNDMELDFFSPENTSSYFASSKWNWDHTSGDNYNRNARERSKLRKRMRRLKNKGAIGAILRCLKNVCVYMMSTVGMCVFVCAYCAFGAWLFVELESPNENTTQFLVMQKRMETLKKMWGITYEVTKNRNGSSVDDYEDCWKVQAVALLNDLAQNVTDAVTISKWDPSGQAKWTFSGSLLFSVAVVTTIGYGNIAPVTMEGRIVVMLYGLFGIPITLLALAKIGDVMAKFFKVFYSKVLCRFCVDQSEPPRVPLYVCLSLVAAYLGLGAFLFNWWENWTYIDAVYFCFTSLTTIGFGDMVPGFDSEEASNMRKVACIAYLLFGLALLAMCFELMKLECQDIFMCAGECLGLVKSEAEGSQDHSGRRTNQGLDILNIPGLSTAAKKLIEAHASDTSKDAGPSSSVTPRTSTKV